MANNFSGLSSLVNLWNFETGALGEDSKGSDDLTSYGDAAASATEAPNQAADSYSLDVQGSDDFLYLADDSLSAGHPWKEGSSGDWTFFGWVYFDSDSAQRVFISKYSTDASYLRSVMMFKSVDGTLGLNWGTSNGTGFNSYAFTNIPLTTGVWYHIEIKYDESETKLYARVWDNTAGDWIYSATPEEATVANSMYRSNAVLSIGAAVYTASAISWDMDGRCDEFGLCNALVSDADLASIKDGTYGASGGGSQSINGSIPTPVGALVKKLITFKEGEVPYQSSSLDMKVIFTNYLTGDLPEQTGSIASKAIYTITLLGNIPTAVGSILKKVFKNISGAINNLAGSLARYITKTFTGDMPSASGDISGILNPSPTFTQIMHKIIGSGLRKLIGG